MRPLILLSNDDSLHAAGLAALREALGSLGDVVVCAPKLNQSAASHSLTLHSVLRLERHDRATFSLDGTPADCIYVALHSQNRVLPRRPDLVVSGMNCGPNLGLDVIYSGTVAAAREGAQRGIAAVAVSASARADTTAAATFAAGTIAALWAALPLAAGSPTPLLNLNIPSGTGWRLQATRLGRRLYDDEVIYRNDPRGREYLWIGGARVEHERTGGTDTAAWEAGEASLTPLSLRLVESGHASLATTVAAAQA